MFNVQCSMLAMGCLMIATSLHAQNSKNDSVQQVDEVVVVGHHAFKDLIPTQTLEGNSLKALNSQSVADALRYFAGLQVKDYGGIGGVKTVDLRSMGTNHLGIYYDGIELGNAQNGQIDLAQFSLDNVEALSLYNGQRSNILQSASDVGSAGTVYIRTRRPIFARGRHTNLRANIKYGSSNMLKGSLLWEERLSESVSSSLNIGILSSDGKYKFRYKRLTPEGTVAYDTTATRENGDILAERFEANIFGGEGREAWNMKAYLYHSSRGIPGAIVNNVWRRGERQADLNTFLQGWYERNISRRMSLRLLGKYAFYRTHYINRDTTQLPVDNRYWQQEYYLSATAVYRPTAWWSLSVAYDAKWNKLNADSYRFAFPTRLSNLLALTSAIDANAVKIQASLLGTFINDRYTDTSGAKARNNLQRLTPALFINYSPALLHSFSFHAFAKKSFRMPTFNDLYYTNMGNADLKPESALQYDMGAIYNKVWTRGWLKEINLKCDAYYNTVDDKIIAYPKGEQFRWTMLNLGKVHITGIDLSAAITVSLATNWTITAKLQYCYQDARDVTDPSTSYYRDQIPYIPYNSGSAIASIAHGPWMLSYSFIYTGERYDEQENIAYNHLQPWYTHDAALHYEFSFLRLQWRATIEVNNIFNQRYDVINNYPMPGTNGSVGLQVNI